MSAATLAAELRTKAAIKSYEEEMGVQVKGNARLEQVFSEIYKVYLVQATLDEMKFRRTLPSASAMTCAAGSAAR